jgi:hypothetical protein
MCAPKRIDGNNLGDSIIVSIGDYEGWRWNIRYMWWRWNNTY